MSSDRFVSSDDALAADFDSHRGHLIGIAYRLTGRLQDAEDAVQEAWLRLAALDADARGRIRDLAAWLTTVVGRICLDRMRSAAHRREQYVGPWLPEPLVTPADGTPDPLDEVVQRDDVRMAAVRVLHELTPDQRLAFVLHDGFDVPFDEIADVLGVTVAAARQHASRGRKRIGDEPPARTELPEQQRLLEEFLAAIGSGDLGSLTEILHPEVTLYGDSGGKARTARRPIVGVDKVGRFILGIIDMYGTERTLDAARPALVNGDVGFVLPAPSSDLDRSGKIHPRVFTASVREGRITEIFDVVNPDKLTHVTL
ncbi:sigma-70 family RNA polymerase sigma factor [Allosaccharopolyspora coralli]|uniref:sigma-70 family RNA polymerase sigma factor n=1 Tax=Allosaccharopolyspora coralli TaxID=2665642 RepID=UPI001E64CA68|nr:sigma-70 family RNA polymerase sigma factor [Allosaccharopolyspora coralli]